MSYKITDAGKLSEEYDVFNIVTDRSLRSEKVNELIFQSPGIINRFALPVFFLVFTVLFAVAWGIKYPEVVKADAILLKKTDSLYPVAVASAAGSYCARMVLPRSKIGNIKLHQPVQLFFTATSLPAPGFVQGQISYVADTTTDTGVIVFISLPGALVTNSGKEIVYKKGLLAEARVQTSEHRLLEELIPSIRKNVNK
jgi:hypothetical protein